MSATFFFYDLETSGFSPANDRVMQFGGQRTDMDLRPIGDPVNVLIKLTEDVLPSPDAILITGITPQQTLAEGLSEREFTQLFCEEIVRPDTIFVGFNSIRFDDEFMRHLLYRNFCDAYEWQWKDSCSRWDLLDVVRMTRALRPEGIKWPFDNNNQPVNRLELLTAHNGLDHSNAHDALSDVNATIALAQMIKNKQPKLFDYLLKVRQKDEISRLVNNAAPFVYSSGKYPSEFQKTTVVTKLADHPKQQGILVYDLRHDPTPFFAMSPEQLAEAWRYKKDRQDEPLPVKTLKFNRCPAVAPMSVLDPESQKRLQLNPEVIEQNLSRLSSNKQFADKVCKALEILDKTQQLSIVQDEKSVDGQLYEGFLQDADKKLLQKIRRASPDQLTNFVERCHDQRLKALLPLYKARNFSKQLSQEEQQIWQQYLEQKLFKGSSSKPPKIQQYFSRLAELAEQTTLTKQQQYLLEELRLYGESLMQ